MNGIEPIAAAAVDDYPSEIFPVDSYISADYARREADRVWGKVWQVACREEEIPKVGDFVTYEIVNQSILIVRSAADRIEAFYNVCMHRGRRLAEGCGSAQVFQCRFHGWQWNLEGKCVRAFEGHDWGGALTPENTQLVDVKVDTWGGYVFVNLDPHCEPLREFLEPAASLLDPYELHRMRFRWRKWLVMPCNWKVALEAFNESYHTFETHPQFLDYMEVETWSRAQGKHGNHGMLITEHTRGPGQGSRYTMRQPRADHISAYAEFQLMQLKDIDGFLSHSLVEAAQRAPVELAPDTDPNEAFMRVLQWNREIDAAKGIKWPEITPEQAEEAGYNWHIFPNTVILQAPTYVLGYRARPNGLDPDSCIFEVYVLDRAPEGIEPPQPKPQRNDDLTDVKFWGRVLLQDFVNMEEVQRGMKARGFPGIRPNPKKEQAIANFHRTIREYMEDA